MDLPDTTAHASRIRRRAFKWRLTTFSAGLLMAATFFMAVVQGCNQTHSPAELVADDFPHTNPLRWLGFAWLASPMFAPYLGGLLAAVAAAGRHFGKPQVHAVAAASVLICGMLVAARSLLFVSRDFLYGTPWSDYLRWEELDYTAAWTIYPLWFLLTIAFSISRPGRRWMCPGFFVCLWLTLGFAALLRKAGDQAAYGMWLSELASIALLIATIGEAVVLSDQSIPRTLWQLLTCRIRLAEDTHGRCKSCGYLLHGLPQPRCPECGLGFDPELLLPLPTGT